MSKLILVYGLTEDTSEEQLLKHLNGLTINAVKATRIWLDPFVKQSPRAVALFEKEIDECELFRCAQTKGSNFKGKPLLFETVTSPQSVVVNINGAIGYGSRDKLRFLFSSKRYNGQKVCEVKQMNQEWFEITFEEKWKAVSIISFNTWEANNVMLKVCPYFTCFQEQCQDQLTRLMSKSKKYNIPEKTYVRKKSTYFFRSRLFTFLMGLLDLKSSIQTHYMELNITIDTDEMEAEIEGPEYETKLVHQTISCEEKKFSFTDLEVQFLTDPEIQETLQNLIKNKKWKIVLNKTTPGFVVDQTGKQVTLMDFLSSLVIVKECSSIPSKDFQDTSDWVSFLQNFYKRYPYCRVMIHNGVVELVSLSYQDQDLDLMVTNVNAKLGKLMSTSLTQTIEDKSQRQRENIEKSTICFQNRIFPWLSNILNIKKGISQLVDSLQVDINEEESEIIFQGPKDELKHVKSLVISESNKISFTDLELEFLTIPEIQECFKKLVEEKKWQLEFDKSQPGFVVTAKSGSKQVTLMDFLSSLVIVKECSSIPSKDFQDTSDWVSFLQNFYKRYPYCRVMIHNGVVELVSLSYQDQDLDLMVTNVNAKLGKLMSTSLTQTIEDKSQRQRENIEKSTICFQNRIFPWLSNILNIKKGISQLVDSLQVDINEEESEIIFQGPKDELKHVKSLVISESNKISFTDLELEFLTIPEIQECFKKLVEEKKWQLEFDKSQPGFVVTAKSGSKQVTLMDFLSSLVIVKECSSIPSKDFQDTSDWVSFLQNFYKRYPYCRVMIHNGVVELVSLSYQDQDLDLMVTNVNAKLGKLMSTSLTQTIEDKSQRQRENIEKSTICFQNRIFPWLSNILNIKKGISQLVDSLQVDINEEESEIIFQGPKDELKHVKSLVISESNKIATTGLELQFMMIPEIQEYFKKLVEDNKWQLEFDSTQAAFFVTDKSGDKQVTLTDFLSSLVIVKDCCSIPSDDFQDSSEWITFLGMIHEKYPFRRVMIHSDIVKLISLSYHDCDLDVMVEMINDKLDKLMRMSITQTIEENYQENTEIIERSTIFFQNKIFLWLLNILNFKHAVSEVVTNLQMDINEEECEIMIAGTREDIKCIKSIALSEKNK
ncbi:hypothetical protein BgiMline_001101, partial [Biomphalaria glabrata]